jgi:aminoglycoside phosphotransferase (APT) family kinase protein
MSDSEEPVRPRTSTRDREEQRRQLTRWLSKHLPSPTVAAVVAPPTNGMSSETLLFDVEWSEDGRRRSRSLVGRIPPDSSAMPVFPAYDMERQFRVMRLVEEATSVPVPPTLWFESDDSYVGAPFFVMERVEGEVPPDLMPYTFGDNWLFDASKADQDRLQEASIAVLAKLHDLAADGEAAFLALDAPGDTHLHRHVADQQAYYQWVVAGINRSPLIERAFGWLDDHWPADEPEAVLSWGDSRVGNIMYRDFEPVAVLDWEMAALGPREIDLGWMIFLHRFFQDLTDQAGLAGMPDFMRRDDAAAAYERLSGHEPRHLDFYTVYAALRHAIVMTRVMRRQVHFGEAAIPDDPDDMILHRSSLESMLAGTYWRDR